MGFIDIDRSCADQSTRWSATIHDICVWWPQHENCQSPTFNHVSQQQITAMGETGHISGRTNSPFTIHKEEESINSVMWSNPNLKLMAWACREECEHTINLQIRSGDGHLPKSCVPLPPRLGLHRASDRRGSGVTEHDCGARPNSNGRCAPKQERQVLARYAVWLQPRVVRFGEEQAAVVGDQHVRPWRQLLRINAEQWRFRPLRRSARDQVPDLHLHLQLHRRLLSLAARRRQLCGLLRAHGGEFAAAHSPLGHWHRWLVITHSAPVLRGRPRWLPQKP